MAANTPHPKATIPTVTIAVDRSGRGCEAFSESGDPLRDSQPELAEALDDGTIPARYDRRAVAQDTLDRVLLRAEQLGVVRFR